MARVPLTGALLLSLTAFQFLPFGALQAQALGTTGHDHLSEVACVDVPLGEKRPEFGCFNIGTVTGLHFAQTSVYWHLREFPDRKSAEAAKSDTGLVVEEDGRTWLSEFGPRNLPLRGGKAIAVIGPMELPAAKNYVAVLSLFWRIMRNHFKHSVELVGSRGRHRGSSGGYRGLPAGPGHVPRREATMAEGAYSAEPADQDSGGQQRDPH